MPWVQVSGQALRLLCLPGSFTKPEFGSQCLHLEEFITFRGHICDFYPKFHCELNLIEQYWGATKFCYNKSLLTTNIEEMEKNMLRCLDDIPLSQILM